MKCKLFKGHGRQILTTPFLPVNINFVSYAPHKNYLKKLTTLSTQRNRSAKVLKMEIRYPIIVPDSPNL